jgi:hypothetical protein
VFFNLKVRANQRARAVLPLEVGGKEGDAELERKEYGHGDLNILL